MEAKNQMIEIAWSAGKQRGHILKSEIWEIYEKMLSADPRLKWVSEVYPDTNRSGGASIDLTWEQWNEMREGLGLRRKPIRRFAGKQPS